MGIEEVRVEEKVDNFFEDDSSSDSLSQESEEGEKGETEASGETETTSEKEGTEAKLEEKGAEKGETEAKTEKFGDTPANRAFAAQRVEIARLREQTAKTTAALEETRRRLAFMEEQQKKAQREREQAEREEKNRIYLEGLREAGAENYEAERDRLLREEIVNAVTSQPETEKETMGPATGSVPDPREVEAFQERIRKTNDRLNADFPDITNRESPLFKKSQQLLFENNTQEEIDYMLQHAPELFYTHVKLANTLLENERLKQKAGQAETEASRQGRISKQGTAHSQGSTASSGADSLTPEQRRWCREMGYNPKEYAKFVHLGEG